MKLATLVLCLGVLSAANAADVQTQSIRISAESVNTEFGTGRIDCTSCVITVVKGASAKVIATSIQTDLTTGMTALSGEVKIAFAGGTLLTDSATITSAADGTAIVRGNRIVIASSIGN